MPQDFVQLPHTADIKIRVYGTTLSELFRNAVIGMFQSIGPHADGCRIVNERLVCDVLPQNHDIEIRAHDVTALLVDFLSHILYLSDVYNEAYLDATIHEISENHVRATVHGVIVQGFDVVEIKAVTYHGLDVKQVDGVWQADVVFDI